MGTVGLSFGSPTGGSGFDVSATVSQIIGNLRNVETPWKTQLSTLQSQDSAISNLGSLLSNLSNDLSSLTDFNGILAQKTGSSSDTSVLELTSASNSATAGSHTVIVNSLARTSSGYLPEMSNASDTLSGSITLQVGNGTQHVINLPAGGGTLDDLKTAINSSGVGITASVLTDSNGSRLSLVSGTSGAGGNITVTANSIVDTTLHSNGLNLSYTDTTEDNAAASGTLSSIPTGDTLTGDVSITGPDGTVTDFKISDLGSNATLDGLAAAITNANMGVTAAVNTANGTSHLVLLSTGSMAVTSNLQDPSLGLGYTTAVTGADANLTIDGVQGLKSASNTVTNLIPGLTFQLLQASPQQSDGTLEPIQVIIGNDNNGVESVINTMVNDYNSLVSGINAQEGVDASGAAEPLFGSPTLSLLQQQVMNGLNAQNPNGYLTAIQANAGTTLSGKIFLSVGAGAQTEVDVPGPPNNTLDGLAAAITAAGASTPVAYQSVPGSDGVTSTATLSAPDTDALGGSMTIQVGDGKTYEVLVPPSPNDSLEGLVAAINATSGIGVTAGYSIVNGVTTMTLTSNTPGADGTLTVVSNVVVPGPGFSADVQTSNGESYLMLQSGTSGSAGTLSVTSQLSATNQTPLSYTDAGTQSSTAPDSGTLGGGIGSDDSLTGSITIGAGTATATTISMASLADKTLSGLAAAINQANAGVTAAVDSSGGITLTSQTNGSDGALTITSNLLDPEMTNTTSLTYSNSSDLAAITALGISMNNDGTISFDATSLDSLLNTDFSSVVGMFQNVNGWGRNFAAMLSSTGTSSSTGILKLAQVSNSNVESLLNKNISKQETLISAQQKSLTAELNSANEILQAIPTQLEGISQLYSAITGYNQSH